MAIQSRKARPDLYERVPTAQSDSQTDEDVDEDEFEAQDAQMVDDSGNTIEEIDLGK
jgi:hypothetical protein